MRTLLLFLENYCAAVTKKYWSLKKEETVNLKIFFVFRFLYLRNIRGHILNISKTIFTKQIFHLHLSDQLPDLVLRKFYIHSTSVIYLCI